MNNIIEGDSLRVISELNNEFDLIITSPPYNLKKEYELPKTLKEYRDWIKPYIYEFYRLLNDSGSLCFQVGNYVDNGAVYPLDCYLFDIFLDAGFIPRNRIVWTFGHGLHAKKRMSGRHEAILWFTKSDNYKFNLDPIRVPQKHPNKKHFKGANKGKLSCNPLGKNPGDVWEITNVKNNHPEKTEHPCQFPEELVRRCVESMTDVNDNVLDPFTGSGTTNKVCSDLNRNCIGIDKEVKYLDIAQNRTQIALKKQKCGGKIIIN